MRQKHASLFRWVMAVALVLSMVVGALPVAPPAEAGIQTWANVDMPTGLNADAIGPIVTANDGTLFLVSNFGAVADLVRSSTSSGATWSAGVDPDAGAATVNAIAVSPNYSTDRTVFAVSTRAAGVELWVSTDGGATFAIGPALWATAGDAATSIAVAPNFNTNGMVAVGLNPTAGTGGVENIALVARKSAGAWAAAFTAVPESVNTVIAAGTDNGGLAVAFSPNYVSDGVVFVVAAGTGTVGGTLEARYTVTDVAAPTVTFVSNLAIHAGNSTFASIAVPSGYVTGSADNYFVGTAGVAASSVFRRVTGGWADSTPSGAATAVTSVVSSGSFSSATLIVGAPTATGPQVRKSTNGGTTWVTPAAPAQLAGTAATPVFLALSQNFATDNTIYAGTQGVNGGVYRSTSGGGTTASWEGTELVSDAYNTITGLATDGTTALIVQNDSAAAGSNAVFRTTNVRGGTPPGGTVTWRKTEWGAVLPLASSVSMSPNFATDSTVYIADAGTAIAKSTNGGLSFNTAFISAIPTGTIIAGRGVVAANGTTVFVLATGGRVHRSSDSGQTWTTYSSNLANVDNIAVSPNFASDSTLLLSGRTSTNGAVVQISTDGGVTWANVGTHPDTSVTTAPAVVTVAFDSNYGSAVTATAKWIYSGTDSDAYRWQVDTSTSWRDMDAGAFVAGAAPNPPTATNVTGIASRGGILYLTTATAADGVRRALYPTATYDGTATTWFNLGFVGRAAPPNIGLADAQAAQLIGGAPGTFTNVGQLALGGTSTGNIILVTNNAATDVVQDYDDNLITAPTLVAPADGAALVAHPGANPPSNAQWSTYAPNVPGVNYQVEVSTSSDFSDSVNTVLSAAQAGISISINGIAGVPTFTSGQNYYWHVRALVDADADAAVDAVSPWSATRSYGASAGAPVLLYPTSAPGLRQEIPTTTPSFSWTNLASATGYEFQLATEGSTATYTGYPTSGNGYMNPLITATTTDVSLSIEPGILQVGGVYYWHVRAIYGSINGPWGFQTGGGTGGSGVFKVAGTPPTPTTIPPTATATPGAGTPTVVPATATPAAPATAATQLASMGTNLVMVITYNPSDTADPWKIYDPAAPAFASDLISLQAGSGYWIYSSAATTLTYAGNSYSLSAGWNLVGWLGG